MTTGANSRTASERAHVAPEPIGELLCPRGFCIRVARDAKDREEDLCLAHFAGELEKAQNATLA